jgi:hypothetical protein
MLQDLNQENINEHIYDDLDEKDKILCRDIHTMLLLDVDCDIDIGNKNFFNIDDKKKDMNEELKELEFQRAVPRKLTKSLNLEKMIISY